MSRGIEGRARWSSTSSSAGALSWNDEDPQHDVVDQIILCATFVVLRS
ncbi:hypothetical protein Br6_04897 [Rhodococcus sp. Br-6]|nr:hypothetical protein Br6_04897 [Rhodococcus sp. Br-6]